MKRTIICFFVALSVALQCFAQSYNQEKTALTRFLVRMYESAPFEGVKVVDDYDHRYLTNFDNSGKKVYMFIKQMEEEK